MGHNMKTTKKLLSLSLLAKEKYLSEVVKKSYPSLKKSKILLQEQQ